MQLKPRNSPIIFTTSCTCYLISGDEPLIVQECADAIRAAARAAGCSNASASRSPARMIGWSLAMRRLAIPVCRSKLIEVQLPSGKPGTEGSRAIQEYLAGDQEDVLLIVSGRIDKQSQKSKWYVALDQAGVVLPVWPISPAELPAGLLPA